ncbi:MAG TPA: hypothetical protein DDX03_00040 [Firmicutes bacterium]|jgi:hypothetical protein|nr:hypothetical protein [Bacillota bacterium]
MAKTRKKSKKSLANNPLILVLVLVLFAAVGANSLGLLDGILGGGQESAPPSPKKPATNTASASQSGDNSAGPEATESAPPAALAEPAAQQTLEQAGGTEKTPAAAVAAVKKEDPKPKPKWDVPDFAFAVGRDNPFAEVAALKTTPASNSNTSGVPRNTAVPVKNPVQSPVPVGPAPGSTKPVAVEKPKEPWESWIFTGLSEHGTLRFAIIETPENAYIVREGDRIEGIWLVEKITGAQVTLRSSVRTIVLVLGGEGK